MSVFLFCLASMVLEVFCKPLQLFGSSNIFSADNVEITKWIFGDEGVFDRL